MRDELKLPYPWLPQLLMKAMAATAYEQLTGESRRLRVEPAELLPGRSAKAEGRHILRDVEWLYRAEINPLPDIDTEAGG